MKKTMTAVATAAAVASPVAAAAATPKKVITVTKTVQGPAAQVTRWGTIQVTLIVKKTTTVVGAKKTVKRRISSVKVPTYPNHTDRSVFINTQAIPLLVQETLTAQFDIGKIDVIGGATDTSYGFGQSLQAALLAAKKV
jgi:uncharacterized protein with FMN-binding domain